MLSISRMPTISTPTHQQAVGERFVTQGQAILVDGSQLILVTFYSG